MVVHAVVVLSMKRIFVDCEIKVVCLY